MGLLEIRILLYLRFLDEFPSLSTILRGATTRSTKELLVLIVNFTI